LKEEIRKKILNLREKFQNSEEHSYLIKENFFSLPEIKNFGTFLLYYPHRGEVNTLPIINQLLKEGKTVLLPKVERDNILPIFISNLSQLKKGYAGIKEPEGEPFPKEAIDLVVVPAVAYDKEGYRIGYGKGYYDRFLADFKGLKVGLAYQFQILDKVPREKHDIPVDIIVTPFEIIKTKKEERNVRNNSWSYNILSR
jgi:5-formyltetrahydrofolate cyclo-ligase